MEDDSKADWHNDRGNHWISDHAEGAYCEQRLLNLGPRLFLHLLCGSGSAHSLQIHRFPDVSDHDKFDSLPIP